MPEFGTNGKDVVTIEQVMLHTSGFPSAPMLVTAGDTSEGRCAAFARWRLNWEPGTRFEYHPTSAHWVLVELLERVTGQDFRDVVQARVTDPAGLPRVLGLEPGTYPFADLVATGEPATPDELEATFGVRELPVTEVTPGGPARLQRPGHPARRHARRRRRHARPRTSRASTRPCSTTRAGCGSRRCWPTRSATSATTSPTP